MSQSPLSDDRGLLSEMMDDADILPSTDKLSNINVLYSKMVALQGIVDDLEARLKLEKQRLVKVTDYDLPAAMSEAGCKKFVTSDGFQLEVKQFYTAKIDDNNREQCYSWLRDHEFGGIIKHQIAVNFNKGEDNLASKLKENLEKVGLTYSDKESIHPQTLNAFVRERVEKGDNFPLNTFNVFIGNTTKCKKV